MSHGFYPCARCGSWPEKVEGYRFKLEPNNGGSGLEMRCRVECKICNKTSDDFMNMELAIFSWNAKQTEEKKRLKERWEKEELAFKVAYES